ncbi:hypothetical protein [Vibrio neptunius]|uniref:PepSY domain-containing protein n=1 Tax=Vibrio neptunius TaxID=170651 RepID=A0ABS3AB43_9VIBR|nr:hypothetical protein [Vibrio neptunius]MBN3495559.1 hypothetical protein [Vibrio neptunius]MBN3518035.1 hypothetical protein [Vibrio neptunius]MBN3552378.1 hypothetical protein [Vibrio neptunius]MBN3580402.1 hypothetical protein [Vibrio neptunius]MCH9874069.1 hypothetical protein [Vibrio neptunius]
MFKSSIAFICLSLTMITPAMANEIQHGPAVSALEALQQIKREHPAKYEYIALAVDENGKDQYVAQVEESNPPKLVKLDGQGGASQVVDTRSAKYNLLDVLTFVENNFRGQIGEAFKEYQPVGVVYQVMIMDKAYAEEATMLQIDANTLKVTSISPESWDDMEMYDEHVEMHNMAEL